MRLYRNQQIEDLAEDRLGRLEKLLGRPLAPPIPLDLVAEKVLERFRPRGSRPDVSNFSQNRFLFVAQDGSAARNKYRSG